MRPLPVFFIWYFYSNPCNPWGRGRALLRRQAARRREQRGDQTSSTTLTLPTQHRTNPHDAVPDALSPVRGPLGDTITSHPSTHAWRAADAGRVPKRVRILQPDLSLEAWGWQPWVGAARENVVGVVRRLVGTKQVTSNQNLLYISREDVCVHKI